MEDQAMTWALIGAIAVVPATMAIVYLVARFLPDDSFFGLVALLGIIPVFILAGCGLLTAWWHVLLASVGWGIVAGIICLPLLLYTDLKKSLLALREGKQESKNEQKA